MKNTIIGIALALALLMGVVAFAETAEPAMDPVPAVTEEAPAEDATAEAPADEAAQSDDETALREAMEAYRNAKQAKRLDDLAEELNGYVEAGTLTREQADLILNSVKERMAAEDDKCPNCGCQLQNSAPRMGGRKGQFGDNRQRGGRMMQGGRMNGRQPDAQSGATPRQPNGQQPGSQAQPNGPMNGNQQAPQR